MKRDLSQDSPANRVIMDKYRKLFSSQIGRDVLADMLTELGFFDYSSDDPMERGQQEYAKRLLRMCGIWKADHRRQIVWGLFNWKVKKKRKVMRLILDRFFGIEPKP